MILLIDNYDSFTYNLVDYFKQIGCNLIIKKNDTSINEIQKLDFDAIVISPGPETPEKAGITNEIIKHFYKSKPILGICLGHQAIGTFFGANLEKLPHPKHGKISKIKTEEDILYQDIKNEIEVTRYHSLTLKNLPNTLVCTSTSLDDNQIMSIKHKEFPIWGIQYHPEAHLTNSGLAILKNWATFNNLID